jgi:NADH-quinone oxidoreductase subunit K
VIALQSLLTLSAVLFIIGVCGFITRRNVLIMFMSVELMLNAANLALVAFSRHNASMDPQVVAMFVMSLAAAEVAVGLAIIVAVFRRRDTVNIDDLRNLKW